VSFAALKVNTKIRQQMLKTCCRMIKNLFKLQDKTGRSSRNNATELQWKDSPPKGKSVNTMKGLKKWQN